MRIRTFAGNEVAAVVEPEKVAGRRVEYRHAAGLTEWYDNGVEAMEHGFTVAGRPAHLTDGDEVVLEMALDGLTAASRDTAGRDLVFRDGERKVLAYEKLVVFDANGKDLPARMEPTVGGFLIAYHDAGATYPVTVDPLIVNEEVKLTASDAGHLDRFGDFDSVAISGATVVVGAHANGDAGSSSGSAYVFFRSGSTWSEQAKLTASDAAADDQFGRSVSVSGDTVVVGAVGDDDGGSDSGSAYVFTRSGTLWSEQAKLTASDAAAGDWFGISVAVSGDTVVVGAPFDDGDHDRTGSVYVFLRSGTLWSQQAKLTSSDPEDSADLGISVSVSGDTVVAGARFDFSGANRTGSVHVYPVPLRGKLLVMDHLGNPADNGTGASAFDGQLIGTPQDYSFTLMNLGNIGLDLQSVSVGGSDAAQFSLILPDISANPDLAEGESLQITITFQPMGSTAPRNATLEITSNDAGSPAYTVNLSGLGLSASEDGDADGMSDWAEYDLRGFGFDWESTQIDLVSDYYEKAPSAGLVNLDVVSGLHANATLLDVDMSTDRAKFTIQLKQSGDLVPPFAPIIADPARISVDGQGRIVYEVDAPAGKQFYLMEVGP